MRKSEISKSIFYHWEQRRYLSSFLAPIKRVFSRLHLPIDDDGGLENVEKGVFDVHCVVKSTP